MNQKIKVLLVDDHELVRKGLRPMLELEGDLEVVGECSNAEEAFSKVEALSPDVVLMDIQMAGLDGIEATRRLMEGGTGFNRIVMAVPDSREPIVCRTLASRGLFSKRRCSLLSACPLSQKARPWQC